MGLEFTGPGVFGVDNLRVYRAESAPYLDLLPEDYAALRSARLSALRTHGFIKTGVRSYDIEQLTNTGGVISGTHKLNSLPQMLAVMRKAAVQPWLQIEISPRPARLAGAHGVSRGAVRPQRRHAGREALGL